MFEEHIPNMAKVIDSTATALGTGFLEVSEALQRASLISLSEKNQVLQLLDTSNTSELTCDYCEIHLDPNSYYRLLDGPTGDQMKTCHSCANSVARRDKFKRDKEKQGE